MRILRIATLVIYAALSLWSASCERPRPEVVLYTSCDDYLLREIIPAFEKESGITVRLAGDTEATKTTGLVQRLLAEKDHPRADVWWSNEAFGTMRLADEGLFAPFKPRALADEFNNEWPLGLRASDDTWYGFALRARVIVYNTARLANAPTRLADLADPRFRGRIGMARPQFGTTRGHMGAILAACGEDAFRRWLVALKANDLRLYDGNSAVVRAVAHGEIDAGLTDSDDVFVGLREKWPVAMIMESSAATAAPATLCVVGPCPIPNTVAIVKNAPHPDSAAKLAEFLLGARVERVLTESESRNSPVRPSISHVEAIPLQQMALQAPNLQAVHAAIPAAMKVCTEVLGD